MTKRYTLELTIGEAKALRNVFNDAVPLQRSRADRRRSKLMNKGVWSGDQTKEDRDLQHLKRISSDLHQITEQYDYEQQEAERVRLEEQRKASERLFDFGRGRVITVPTPPNFQTGSIKSIDGIVPRQKYSEEEAMLILEAFLRSLI